MEKGRRGQVDEGTVGLRRKEALGAVTSMMIR